MNCNALKLVTLFAFLTSPWANAVQEKSMWVWGSEAINDSTIFFEFAQSTNTQHIYLDSYQLLRWNPSVLSAFVNEAAANGLTVELLFGAKDWIKPETAGFVAMMTRLARDFALSHPNVTAIHYDVEPHGYKEEWESSNAAKNALANQYLDMFDLIYVLLAETGSTIHVHADIAFWYDEILLTRGGETRLLSETVIDTIDGVTIMDYRDTASPIIDFAYNEITYAASIGKRAVIGVETNCLGADDAYLTFCEESEPILDSVLTEVFDHYTSNPGFGGVAVHHYNSYKDLPTAAKWQQPDGPIVFK